MKKVPVGEMRDELARRRINDMLTNLQNLADSIGEIAADEMWEELANLQGQMNATNASVSSMTDALSSAQADIGTLTSGLATKNPMISASAAIADASTGLTITLLTQVAISINSTNTKINQILAALRAAKIILP